MITVQELIQGIEAKNGFPLDQPQKDAIAHGNGPLLVAAGPGTGKTEVLVARALKFLCCDGVQPGSIMLTSFTDKAARNLDERLEEGFAYLVNLYPRLANVDTAEIRVGTLHGLCNRILQEQRYTPYQNCRLLDGMESELVVHKDVAMKISNTEKNSMLSQFKYLFRRNPNSPTTWDWATALSTLFNRLIEDQIDLSTMQASGRSWSSLYQAIQLYEQALNERYACDFAHLLRHFHEFLASNESNVFLQGSQDGFNIQPSLTHVLVDEYQDTNPIQESIYLRLCDTAPHNLTVVGDDDQALYRFRGGNVDCMVGFKAVCQNRWNTSLRTVYLNDNHRSDDGIVKWCNDYMASFPVMKKPNARITGKPMLNPASGRTSSHPPVGLIRRAKVEQCALDFANLIYDLRDNSIVQDYSQCALLLPSTRNSPRAAGPYLKALRGKGIPIYNPRSGDYQEQEEVAQALGAFIRIVDPQLNHLHNLFSSSRARKMAESWVAKYDTAATLHPELAHYIAESGDAIQKLATSKLVEPNTPTIPYRIFAHEPFVSYRRDPERRLRLSKLTRLFEKFCALYGRQLRTSSTIAGDLPSFWYGDFCYGLSGYIAQRGLDDDEDEDEICPAGHFPVMTIHQAKGLEFDFVFVGNLGSSVPEDSSHFLEHDLRKFRINQPLIAHTTTDAAWHDAIRKHFVAYSRARHGLVLIATDGQLRKKGTETASFSNCGGGWARQNALRL